MSASIIDLSPIEFQCHICEEWQVVSRHEPSYGIPIYEDEIVPDDYQGEWGGVSVCRPCFDTTRQMQADAFHCKINDYDVRKRVRAALAKSRGEQPK